MYYFSLRLLAFLRAGAEVYKTGGNCLTITSPFKTREVGRQRSKFMSRTKTPRTPNRGRSANKTPQPPHSRGPGSWRARWIWLVVLLCCGTALGALASKAQMAWRNSDSVAVNGNPPSDGAGTKEPDTVPPNCCTPQDENPTADAPLTPPGLPDGVALRINPTPPTRPAPECMVWIPGGVYWRGSETKIHRDARPWHLVEVDGFWMDAAPVTNEQFEKFVKATNHVTVSERTPKAEDFPGAPPENLVAGSVVFSPPKGPVPLNDHLRWWSYIKGASWRHPEGPASDLKGREKHPVVHVAYEDAQAYCKWAGKRLPTEAEFEFASRGGLDRNKYAWGNDFRPDGKWMANIWQGRFPYENTKEDGYAATSPVGAFPANRFQLKDVSGNVWQWCSDWYRHDYYQTLAAEKQPIRNPQGPKDSLDPAEPRVAKRVMRGGSYLCTDQYCTAYESGARGKGAADTGTSHLGFRCVRNP
jgi:formylglycine-generating enzyme